MKRGLTAKINNTVEIQPNKKRTAQEAGIRNTPIDANQKILKMVEKPKQVINFIERNKLRIREKSDMNQLKPQTILN